MVRAAHSIDLRDLSHGQARAYSSAITSRCRKLPRFATTRTAPTYPGTPERARPVLCHQCHDPLTHETVIPGNVGGTGLASTAR